MFFDRYHQFHYILKTKKTYHDKIKIGDKMKETELYEPIKKLLEEEGYHIKAEVGHVDVYGIKENQTIAVELKTTISLKLIYQALDRKKVADIVFIGIPLSATKSHRKDMKYLRELLAKLGIGIIVVSQNDAKILLTPDSSSIKKRDNVKKRRVVKEFNQRANHQNIGGTQGKKITAYKENAIRIAYMLRKMKNASPKELMEHTGINKAPQILQANYDNWFMKVSRGVYQLTELGEKELDTYLEVLDLG
jgi:hypothetical protein